MGSENDVFGPVFCGAAKEYDFAIDLYQSAMPDNGRELAAYGGATGQGGSDETRLLR